MRALQPMHAQPQHSSSGSRGCSVPQAELPVAGGVGVPVGEGFIQRWSHGRFMIMGARDGADMFAVFGGRVRGSRCGVNGASKFRGEVVIHLAKMELAERLERRGARDAG